MKSYDLFASSGSSNADRASVVGYAAVGGICSSAKYSIIEYNGGFGAIIVS